MKIEKHWGGQYVSSLSIYMGRYCLDFNFHPREWSTPNISVSGYNGNKLIDFCFLCFSIGFSYDASERYYGSEKNPYLNYDEDADEDTEPVCDYEN